MEIQVLFSLPLIIASFFAVFMPVFDAILKKNKQIIFIFTLLNFLLVIVADIFIFASPEFFTDILKSGLGNSDFGKFLSDAVSLGGYTSFFDLLFAIAGILTLFAAKDYLKKESYELKEFYSLVSFSFAGMLFIAHANNLLILFLGIELMSISFFVLSGFFRNNILSIEASLKYFILGAFATGFLIFGFAMLYGATGSLELKVIAQKISFNQVTPIYFALAIGFIFVGLAFKASTFPFHQWAPDVYTGAPTVVTGFMSTAGKTAAFAAFIVITKTIFLSNIVIDNATVNPPVIAITRNSREILAIIAALTMLVGNITALMQTNVKRMLAFSSVAHAGYILLGIVANNSNGWSGIVFYAFAYVFMQIGAFVIVSLIEKENDSNLNLSDYNGLSKSHPFLAASMAIFMFSLVGLPPFAGFFGKYYLFLSVVQSGYLWLALVAVIASIISIYFYIGLIINMYFKEKEGEPLTVQCKTSGVSIILSLIGVIFLGIFPSLLMNPLLNLFK
jgi:NADH-quinone oxidoreductase subunit N